MLINLIRNNSENNAINKSLTSISTENCVVKGSISMYTPSVILTYDGDMYDINYAYIEEYNRYYYVTDIVPTTGNRYELRLKCDVLESFRDDILNLRCIIDKQQNVDLSNKYINDGSYVVENKDYNTIYNFKQGFNETGTFILTCAGGNGSL